MARMTRVLILLFSGLLMACGEEVQVEERLRPVRFVEAQLTGSSQMLSFSGSSHADQELNISFKVSGTVAKKAVKVGDKVKKGQLLYALDPKDYRIGVQQAEASLTSAEANYKNALANYDRLRLLYENNNASRNDLDGAKANAESSKANVRSVSKQLESSRNQYSYTKLTSPALCFVAETIAKLNENINVGQTVAQLNCGDSIEVTILVPEIYIAQVKEGDAVSASFSAIKTEIFAATVTEVSVSSGGSSTYPVRVKLNKKDSRVRSGMAANVSINLSGEKEVEVFYLPSHAVAEDANGRFVYVVQASDKEVNVGVIHRKPVTTGKLNSKGMEVLSGLVDFDKVVTAGVSFLSEGMRVKFPSGKPSGKPSEKIRREPSDAAGADDSKMHDLGT